MIESGSPELAHGILARLNHQLSPIGKPFQRAAFYMKEALLQLLTNPTSSFSPTSLLLKIGAYKSFSEISPLLQFANFTSNQALLEAVDGFTQIHIIDFDIGFASRPYPPVVFDSARVPRCRECESRRSPDDREVLCPAGDGEGRVGSSREGRRGGRSVEDSVSELRVLAGGVQRLHGDAGGVFGSEESCERVSCGEEAVFFLDCAGVSEEGFDFGIELEMLLRRRFGHQVAETPARMPAKVFRPPPGRNTFAGIDARACLGTGTKPRVFRPPGGRNTRVVTSECSV
ncbi:Scarecrow-like protein 6 [Senna tora]|uniref:Scarecrow-like protein 6 n=1 Tax=Senna tora TaxID=362788 RepID=A0A834TPC5_9FABA|nr:Scarecrow-like protein 6 [Senna tora]